MDADRNRPLNSLNGDECLLLMNNIGVPISSFLIKINGADLCFLEEFSNLVEIGLSLPAFKLKRIFADIIVFKEHGVPRTMLFNDYSTGSWRRDFDDGSIYEGEWVHKNMQGKGQMKYADNTVYTGDWVNN